MNFSDEDYGRAGRSGRFMKVCASSLSAECHAYLKYLSQPRQESVEVHCAGAFYLCTVDTLIVYMIYVIFL